MDQIVGFFCSTREFLPIWRRQNYLRAVNFDLYTAFIDIDLELWVFFSVPHLSREISVYNRHLREHMSLTPITERFTLELSLYILRCVSDGIRTLNPPYARRTLNPTAPYQQLLNS